MITILQYIEFINEAKTKEWMDVGSHGESDMMRIDDTQKYKILHKIWESGQDGIGYTDIVRFIVEDLKGIPKYDWRVHRGYYGTNLLGGGFYSRNNGILGMYCEKNEGNKWILTNKKLNQHFRLKGLRGTMADLGLGGLL